MRFKERPNYYINESTITKIIENCLKLKEIQFYNCSNISKEFILKIKKKTIYSSIFIFMLETKLM